VEPGGNIGARGEFGIVCEAVATILHIGQPAFGVNEAIVDVDKAAVNCRFKNMPQELDTSRGYNGRG
jgi:hypothetical protein